MNQIKDLIEYLFNAVKIWVIIQPWQSGLRVRAGNKITKIEKGLHFKIPYFDSIFVQETRLRVADLPMQTITIKDEKTITLNGAAGYSISDVEKLYKTLYHPETTIKNIIMSSIAQYCYDMSLQEIKKAELEEFVLKTLSSNDYGINFEYFKIMSFAVVKTYRLIQDQTWTYEGLNLDTKK